MNHSKILLFLISNICLLIISCAKDPQIDMNPKPTIVFSKSSVKIGEPLYATSSGGPAGTTIKWTTGINGQVWFSGNTDTATFLFTSPGTNQVKAVFHSGSNMTGYDSSYTSITVIDSLFTDTSTAHCDVVLQNSLTADDQISLTPVSFSDTGLIFVAHTLNAYPHSPILNCGGNLPPSGGSFECDISSTLLFACFGSALPSPAVGIVSFTSVTSGTFPLIFKLNGTSYTGSLAVTNTQATITWSYSSGVTISPLSIQKQ